jgi:cystathionine beta-lyase
MIYDFDTPVIRRGTNCEKWDELEAEFGRGDLLPFWVADMDFKSPPEIIEALRDLVDRGVFGYPIMTASARESVSEWLKTRHGWNLDPSAIAFSPGVISSLCVAIQTFTEPGDGVAIQTPVYSQFFSVIERNKRTIVENPLKETDDGYEMDFENLREILTRNVKVLILCSPHNPVARVWRRDELAKLAEICSERGVIVISDEIHQDMVFSDARHIPMGLAVPEFEPFLLTLLAPSKTFNIAGLCSSVWIAEDRSIARRMNNALGALHMANVNMLALAALEAAYRRGAPWLGQLMEYLEKNRGIVKEFLRVRLPGVKLKHPEGTFVFWLDFRSYGLKDGELQRVLVKNAGVALNPGIRFGKQGDGFARFNIGCPKAQLEEGLSRIERAFQNRETSNAPVN